MTRLTRLFYVLFLGRGRGTKTGAGATTSARPNSVASNDRTEAAWAWRCEWNGEWKWTDCEVGECD